MSSQKKDAPNICADDTFKILLATDIHLGYEFSKKRGHQVDDSFITFEEILQYAKDSEVDFILLGGDLFHDTKPPQNVILKCMELLRKYCLGPRQNKIEFLSNPELIFPHCPYKVVNYEDPNINVSIPVFTIHGNHDDPSFGTVGALDLLSVSGLLNYFGKWTDLNHITIPPLVLKKGESYLALYGLSYINDQRLSRLLRDYKMDMLRPAELDCFNIFVLHQNRAKHSKYGYIPETKLPQFLNLILWGHEHECRISPEFISDGDYFITQPGSSIATSLCEGEAVPKHVGLLSINKSNFKLKKLRLRTVRPFIFENLTLSECNIERNYAKTMSECISEYVDKYIENHVMPKAAEQLTGHANQPHQPLVRIRIFYTRDEEKFDEMRISQKYCDEVANPLEMIIFRKEKPPGEKSKSTVDLDIDDDLNDIAEMFQYENEEQDWSRTVQGAIKKYFAMDENKDKLTVLSVVGLNEALNRYIVKADSEAFREVVRYQMNKTIDHLMSSEVKSSTESICNEIKKYRNEKLIKDQQEQEDISQLLNNACKQREEMEIDDNNEEQEQAGNTKGKGRGRARGRGSRGGTTRGRANRKDALDVTTTSAMSKSRSKKTQAQSSFQRYITNYSSQSNAAAAEIFLDDSD